MVVLCVTRLCCALHYCVVRYMVVLCVTMVGCALHDWTSLQQGVFGGRVPNLVFGRHFGFAKRRGLG